MGFTKHPVAGNPTSRQYHHRLEPREGFKLLVQTLIPIPPSPCVSRILAADTVDRCSLCMSMSMSMSKACLCMGIKKVWCLYSGQGIPIPIPIPIYGRHYTHLPFHSYPLSRLRPCRPQ